MLLPRQSQSINTTPSTSATTPANVPVGPAELGTNTVHVVQPGYRNIASYIYKKNADKCKSDIDQLIMDLFIMDFQPLRILEEKGFRKLIQSAFPFYTIPTRKYFSNNILPSRYESLRAVKMKEVENEVE